MTIVPAPRPSAQEPPDPSTVEEALRAPYRIHLERRRAALEELSRLDRKSALVANLRGLSFFAAAILGGLAYFQKLPGSAWYGAGAMLAAFLALAILHQRLFRREEHGRVHVLLSERGLSRIHGGWHRFPEKGERFADPAHLYAGDLDVFGQGSLFQLLDEAATRAGEERLARMLASPADLATLVARQGAIRELRPLLDFREGLAAEGRLLSRDKAEPAGFLRWAEGGPYLDRVRWARPLAWVLPLMTLAFYLLGDAGVLWPGLWWAGLAAQLLVIALTRKELGDFYERIASGEGGFARYEDLFRHVARQPFQAGHLQRLASELSGGTSGGERASRALTRFGRLFSFAELRRTQLHAIINLLTLWDLHWLFRLEAWRRREGARLRRWFDALAELEALGSLAGLAHDRPTFTFPELRDGGPLFEARGLGHPLLDHPVRNDVSLAPPRQALLITGSNMSGKTTLVRAMGANAVLALAGAPVCAEHLALSPLAVLTSMRVKDSLERGVSYFYAEVERLKAVLEAAREARGRALFLLDEILLGTNTAERQIASREVLRLLLATGALGAVTTHDLSLAVLEAESGGAVKNVHFRDTLEGGRMSFDYRLREGVVDTTNALRVLRQAGIPVSER